MVRTRLSPGVSMSEASAQVRVVALACAGGFLVGLLATHNWSSSSARNSADTLTESTGVAAPGPLGTLRPGDSPGTFRWSGSLWATPAAGTRPVVTAQQARSTFQLASIYAKSPPPAPMLMYYNDADANITHELAWVFSLTSRPIRIHDHEDVLGASCQNVSVIDAVTGELTADFTLC